MKTSKQLFLVTILMGSFFALAGCNDQDATSTAKISNKSWNLPVVKAELVSKPVYYSSTGSVVTDQRIDIASPAAATVRKILVANGSKVTKGQTLAILQSTSKKRREFRIISPVSGIVVTRNKRVGDQVAPRGAILTVNLSQGFIFETYVSESRIGKIKVNEKVFVHIDALDTSVVGTVARIASSGDPVARRYRVKVVLPGKKGLFPGMFARSRFRMGSEDVLVIPDTALIERGGLQGIFVVDTENKANFRWLRLGKTWSKSIEVLSGLEAGEKIINVNEIGLRDGDQIKSEDITNE